ncbi:nitrous oxide reductase accessory protein NosL [Paenibacillus daejeonensis]|uniref:nitrous oxide reductase accessory protein NosL n=1 Tax=Paenibacillus daejeonensis TaxID=135193 RepID=UPI00037FACB0|nr:nitrous oxide reductase accessory protein NosL [Paenibacillus daejeonensis]
MRYIKRVKRQQVNVWAVLLLTMVLAAACGGPSYEPHPIDEATDRCAICNMAIKDDEFATQIITKDGQSLKFDDIGCMNEWKTEYGTDTVGAEFVRDYTNSKWLKYEDAYYVYDATIQTPMAYGIVSFEQEAEAEAFMAEYGAGELMTAADLANHSWEVNREMMEMSGMEGHSHSHDGEVNAHGSDGEAEMDAHGDSQDGEMSQHDDEQNGAMGAHEDEQEAHGDRQAGHEADTHGAGNDAGAAGQGANKDGEVDQPTHEANSRSNASGHGSTGNGDAKGTGYGMTANGATATGTAA